MTKSSKNAKKASKGLAGKVSKKGTTHLALLCDESGSMNGNEEAVTGGVNEFVENFKDTEGDIRVWLGFFDAHPQAPRVRIKLDGEKVTKVKSLTVSDYTPRGMTPLNDAIVDTIEAMDKKVGKKDRAFVVILTDGLENASENSAETVKDLIAAREEQGWAFLYLGANHNAVQSAAAIGLGQQHALQFTSSKKGTSSSMRAATTRSESYLAAAASPDPKAAYSVMATEDSKRRGGVVDEDADE